MQSNVYIVQFMKRLANSIQQLLSRLYLDSIILPPGPHVSTAGPASHLLFLLPLAFLLSSFYEIAELWNTTNHQKCLSWSLAFRIFRLFPNTVISGMSNKILSIYVPQICFKIVSLFCLTIKNNRVLRVKLLEETDAMFMKIQTNTQLTMNLQRKYREQFHSTDLL